MSSLIVASNLDLMMLEIAVDQLVVPRVTEFDSAVMKKSVVMFRLLDKEWTTFFPQRSDYQVYRGSNREVEPFNGGVSVVFPIPQSSLEKPMEGIDLQLHVHRQLSKYFELRSSQSVGLLCVDVSDLFNRVIAALSSDRALHPRKPVSSSMKETYPLLAEDGTDSGARLTLYLRVTHLGHSVISEIEVPETPARLFYAKEETSQTLPYQCREITPDDLTGGCWGSGTLLPPRNPRDTICCCCGQTDGKSGALKTGDKDADGYVGSDPDRKKGKKEEKDGKKEEKDGKKEEKDGKKEGKDGKGEKNKKGEKGGTDSGGDGSGKKEKKKGEKHGKGGSAKEDSKSDDSGTGTGDEKSGDYGGEKHPGVSCIEKPALCGREGTCNKKDKKRKFGKCGRPDGEGGNPLACGDRRKCALRRSAAGSATVGIVDKRIPCPQAPICPCPPPAMAPCTPAAPCTRCQPVYYGSAYVAKPALQCQNYLETSSPYIFAERTNCRQPQIASWQ